MTRVYALIPALLFALCGPLTEARVISAEGQVHDAAFSPDGEFIVTATSIGVQLWDSETLDLLGAIPIEAGAWMIKWSPNGRWLFILSVDNEQSYMLRIPEFVVLYTIPYSMKIPREENCYAELRNALADFIIHHNFLNFSDDSSLFAFITSDNEVVVIESESGEEVSRNSDGDELLTIIYFMENDQSLLTDIVTIDVSTGIKIDNGLDKLFSFNDYQILANYSDSIHISFIDLSAEIVFVQAAVHYEGLSFQYHSYVESVIFDMKSGRRYQFPHSITGLHDTFYFRPCLSHTPHRYFLVQNNSKLEYRILLGVTDQTDNQYYIINSETMMFFTNNQNEYRFDSHGASPYYMNPYSSDFQRILTRGLDGTLSLVDLREPASGVEHFEQY